VLILISRQLLESLLLILQMQPLLELIAKKNGLRQRRATGLPQRMR
jgi:hypothetical protein